MKLNNKGFTLVEILAVLVILAAIMGLAIPNFSSSLEVSEKKQEKNRIGRIESAAEIYVTNNRRQIYENLGNNNICYISVLELNEQGYISVDDTYDEKGNQGYVIFDKNNNNYKYNDVSEGSLCKIEVKQPNYIEEISTISTTKPLQKSQSVVYESYNFDDETGKYELIGTNFSYNMLDSNEFKSLEGMIGQGKLKYVCNDFNSSSCTEMYELESIAYNSGGTTSTLTYIIHNAKKN